MDTKKIWVSILITIVITLNIFSSCKKDNCISNAYQFREKWKILPEKDSINIGDTLIFLSKISNKPFDFNTNKNIDYSGNATINSTFGIYILKNGSNNFIGAVDSFKFINIKGKLVTDPNISPSNLKQTFHDEYQGEYIIECLIIAQKKGIYLFGLSDGISVRKSSTICKDGASIQFTNSNVNNHIYFEEQFYGTTNIPESDRTHGYAFKVK